MSMVARMLQKTAIAIETVLTRKAAKLKDARLVVFTELQKAHRPQVMLTPMNGTGFA